MLDKTDRHYRCLARLISNRAVLYTEMIPTGAILKGDTDYQLKHDARERPLALQLGGSNAKEMSLCARIAQDYGYDEININIGCPSNRAQSGKFGACLMAKPELVAESVDAMRQNVDVPITVKSRIGIDNRDSYEELCNFVHTIATAGCRTFIIHARKAWLRGLSPKQNREIPPLNYTTVYRLKDSFPQLEIIINGGIKTLRESLHHLRRVDGVMIGREAYNNVFMLRDVDQQLYGEATAPPSRKMILRQLLPYIEDELSKGTHINRITRHTLGLFQGMPGARQWRRQLSNNRELGIGPLKRLITALED